jgi:hypothetical protein
MKNETKMPMVEAKATWQRGGIAVVCEKCTKSRFAEDFPKLADDERLKDVKGYFKSRLKKDGLSGAIRIVTSSCLDVCARGGMTALIDPIGFPNRSQKVVVVDALDGRDELYARIIAECSPQENENTKKAP